MLGFLGSTESATLAGLSLDVSGTAAAGAAASGSTDYRGSSLEDAISISNSGSLYPLNALWGIRNRFDIQGCAANKDIAMGPTGHEDTDSSRRPMPLQVRNNPRRRSVFRGHVFKKYFQVFSNAGRNSSGRTAPPLQRSRRRRRYIATSDIATHAPRKSPTIPPIMFSAYPAAPTAIAEHSANARHAVHPSVSTTATANDSAVAPASRAGVSSSWTLANQL